MPPPPFSSGARLREANTEPGAPQPQVVFFLSQSPSRQKIRLWSCWLEQQLTRKHFSLRPLLRPVEHKHPEYPRAASQGVTHCTVASCREPPSRRGERGTAPACRLCPCHRQGAGAGKPALLKECTPLVLACLQQGRWPGACPVRRCGCRTRPCRACHSLAKAPCVEQP